MNEDNQAIANLSESVLQPVDVTPEKNEIENERFGLVGKKFSVLIEIKLKQNNIYCNDNTKRNVSSRVRFKTNTFSLQHTKSLRCCKYLIKDTFQELEDWKG